MIEIERLEFIEEKMEVKLESICKSRWQSIDAWSWILQEICG